jgi:hypothetical protein
MKVYQHEKLSLTTHEIRLLQLLHGDSGDEVRFIIYHVSMVKPKQNPRPKRMSRKIAGNRTSRLVCEDLQGHTSSFAATQIPNLLPGSIRTVHSFDHSIYGSFNPISTWIMKQIMMLCP